MYYRVIDLLRPESANFRSAAAAAHQYIISNTSVGKKPDVKAFLVALFGAEEFSKFSKS